MDNSVSFLLPIDPSCGDGSHRPGAGRSHLSNRRKRAGRPEILEILFFAIRL